MLTLDVCQVDDESRLFISPAIQEWAPLQSYKIDTVIDLEGGLDHCIPTMPGECLYVYFPILDEQLPPLAKLHGIAQARARRSCATGTSCSRTAAWGSTARRWWRG